jgi:H+/Cl- antiporter ClcA
LTNDQLGLFLGLLALIFVLLPHWLDPVILWRERLEGWEEKPSPHRLFWVTMATLIAVVFAAIGAFACDWYLRLGRS